MRRRYVTAVILCVITSALSLWAQSDRASVNGTVTDASGALIPTAKIEVVSPDTGYRREATTGVGGTYQISGLPIGTYKVTITKEGFKSASFPAVILSVGETKTIDVRM